MLRDRGGFYARGRARGKAHLALWTRAEAGLPFGWLLVGVMHREVISRWSTAAELSSRWRTDDDWVALAVETDGPGLASGSGSRPEQALANLAESSD